MRLVLPYFLGFMLLGFAQWLSVSFDSPSIDQILYHLKYSEGLGFDLGRIFVFTFIVECLAFPLLLAIGAAALQQALTRFLQDRGFTGWSVGLRRMLRAGVPLAGGVAILLQLSFFSWIGYRFAEDRFSAHYVEPPRRVAAALPKQGTRNLVLIYVESLEETYGDARVWGRDLLQPLRRHGGLRFANYQQASGTNWTIAGMVGTQCAVPLRIVSYFDVKPRDDGARTFLPGATCLGDVLAAHGYRNVFLGGAPLSFSGKGRFLKDHGYHQTYGREEWQAEGVPDTAVGEWGLFDDELMQRAKAKLDALHASGQRFNLTLLTLDTHNPFGFRSPTCMREGIRSFEDIIECTSRRVSEFVDHIRERGYLKDTTVVILGDHLAVSNPVYDRLRGIERRTLYNQFIGDALPAKATDEVLPFDMFPTILDAIGVPAGEGRLGLGYSAFRPSAPVLAARPAADLPLAALGGSAGYSRLWDPD